MAAMAAVNQAQKVLDTINGLLGQIDMEPIDSICGNKIELYAIRDWHNEAIKVFLEAGIKFPGEAFQIASIFGNLEAAQLIAPQHKLTTTDYNDMLHTACAFHNYNFAKWCIANGADVNSNNNLLLSIKEIDFDAWIEYSCDSNEYEYQDIEIEDDDDKEAVKYEGYELTYLLLLHGADIYAKEEEEEEVPPQDIFDKIPDKAMAERLREVAKKVRMEKVVTMLSAMNCK
jgi:hypothetical protein